MNKTINEKLELYKQHQRQLKQKEIIISRLVLAGAISISLLVGFVFGVFV